MGLTVLALSKLSDEGAARVEAMAPGIRVLRAPSREEAEALAGEADVIYGTRLSGEAVARARRLRWVHAPAAGVDRLLTPELVASPVVVTCSRGMHAASLSEHAFSLMLALSRRLLDFQHDRASRHWERRQCSTLQGKTLLVVGLGAVGRQVALKGQAFGMRVLGVRRQAEGVPGVDELFAPDRLREALARSDWVVLCLALTPETRHYVGAGELAVMKPTAFLINVARGEVVDEAALLEALRSGRIAGAGLDVFATEPLPDESPFWELPNVVMTPHVGGSMDDYEGRALEIFLANLGRFLRGESLENVVDKARGY